MKMYDYSNLLQAVRETNTNKIMADYKLKTGEEILQTYQNEKRKISSKRRQFKNFGCPFYGEILILYCRTSGNVAYKVRCPNNKIYTVFDSEIELEEHKSEPKKQENLADTYNELINLINETNKKAENLCKTKNKQQLAESLKNILNIRNEYQYLDPIPIVLDSAIELIKNYISKM